jgi:hypothetical protein
MIRIKRSRPVVLQGPDRIEKVLSNEIIAEKKFWEMNYSLKDIIQISQYFLEYLFSKLYYRLFNTIFNN